MGLWESPVRAAALARSDQVSWLAEPFWDSGPERVRVPYAKTWHLLADFPSSSALVECAVNLAGPPAKPKYSLVTDSGRVP